MATSRVTFGALLGAVGDAAGTVSTVLNTATATVGMAAKFIDDAAEQQRIRSIVNMDSFSESLAEESAIAESARKIEIENFCKKSDRHALHFNNAYDRIKTLLETSKK